MDTFRRHLRADENGIEALLWFEDRAKPFSLAIAVRPKPWLRMSTRSDAWWSLASGLPGEGCRDAFMSAVGWVKRRLPEPFPLDRYRRVRDELHALAQHAAGLCDPSLRRLALRFRPRNRFEVYALAAGDPTGRVAQLAHACPGALLLCCHLLAGRKEQRWIAERLLKSVQAGRRLDRVLDEAIIAFLERRPPHGVQLSLFENDRSRRRPSASDRDVGALRLLIRRASPLVPSQCLLVPWPGLVPEDIPTAPRANASWYRLMLEATAVASRDHRAATELARAFASFVSGNAARLSATLRERPGRSLSALSELYDWYEATGRVPARRSDPQKAFVECDAWHRRLGDSEVARELLAAFGCERLEQIRFPVPPMPGFVGPGLQIEPVVDAQRLFDEGREMRHCVVTRVLPVLEGRSAIYSASIEGQRLTVELVPGYEGWKLGEVKGVCNREPTREERTSLERWIGRGGAASGLRDAG